MWKIFVLAASMIFLAICASVVMHYATLPYSASLVFRPVWLGPDDEFKHYYDRSGDGQISRREWEYSDAQTNLLSREGSIKLFVFSDCDENGILTWKEYFNYFFDGKTCSSRTAYSRIIEDWAPRYTEDAYLFPLILDTSTPKNSLEEMSIFDNAEEVEFNQQDFDKVVIRCGDSEIKRIPSEYSLYENREVNVVSCSVSNGSKTYTVLSILLRADYFNEGNETSSIHIKPLKVPPGNYKNIEIFYSYGSVPIGVSILRVNGNILVL